jgi:hypothetical protein
MLALNRPDQGKKYTLSLTYLVHEDPKEPWHLNTVASQNEEEGLRKNYRDGRHWEKIEANCPPLVSRREKQIACTFLNVHYPYVSQILFSSSPMLTVLP